MTRKFLLIAILFATLFSLSCSKKDNSSTDALSDTPTAKSQYDNSNYGIYKGVFVGSSGIVVLDISNSGTVTVMLKVDGTTYNFTTSQTIQQNQATTLNFVSGSNSFTFTVTANGATPIITNLIFSGHPNASILVIKETSSAIVKCYEGTYSGGASGTFNAVIYNNQIKGLVKDGASSDQYIATGAISNNQINASGIVTGGATFIGAVSGNNISGTWTNTLASTSGTWSGVRTY